MTGLLTGRAIMGKLFTPIASMPAVFVTVWMESLNNVLLPLVMSSLALVLGQLLSVLGCHICTC